MPLSLGKKEQLGISNEKIVVVMDSNLMQLKFVN